MISWRSFVVITSPQLQRLFSFCRYPFGRINCFCRNTHEYSPKLTRVRVRPFPEGFGDSCESFFHWRMTRRIRTFSLTRVSRVCDWANQSVKHYSEWSKNTVTFEHERISETGSSFRQKRKNSVLSGSGLIRVSCSRRYHIHHNKK